MPTLRTDCSKRHRIPCSSSCRRSSCKSQLRLFRRNARWSNPQRLRNGSLDRRSQSPPNAWPIEDPCWEVARCSKESARIPPSHRYRRRRGSNLVGNCPRPRRCRRQVRLAIPRNILHSSGRSRPKAFDGAKVHRNLPKKATAPRRRRLLETYGVQLPYSDRIAAARVKHLALTGALTALVDGVTLGLFAFGRTPRSEIAVSPCHGTALVIVGSDHFAGLASLFLAGRQRRLVRFAFTRHAVGATQASSSRIVRDRSPALRPLRTGVRRSCRLPTACARDRRTARPSAVAATDGVVALGAVAFGPCIPCCKKQKKHKGRPSIHTSALNESESKKPCLEWPQKANGAQSAPFSAGSAPGLTHPDRITASGIVRCAVIRFLVACRDRITDGRFALWTSPTHGTIISPRHCAALIVVGNRDFAFLTAVLTAVFNGCPLSFSLRRHVIGATEFSSGTIHRNRTPTRRPLRTRVRWGH